MKGNNISFLLSSPAAFGDLSAGLSGTFQLCIALAAKITLLLSEFSWNIKLQVETAQQQAM